MWFFSEKLSSKQIPEKVGCLQLFIGMEGVDHAYKCFFEISKK